MMIVLMIASRRVSTFGTCGPSGSCLGEWVAHNSWRDGNGDRIVNAASLRIVP
ncbi:hypothetical protein BR93DRAFT_922523 [Coniochaeta sp. PMI_546]|nr:hypothetical protein BR93DRAFT_922523 [Coniochaeta sp. PMI_546]